MISIDVKFDVKKLTNKLNKIQRTVIPAATSSALNKVAITARKESSSIIIKRMGKSKGLSAAGFKRLIKIRKSNKRTLVAILSVTGRHIPLIAFSARKAKGGVVATAWGKRKLYKGAFIAKVQSGHRGVFKRSGSRRGDLKRVKKGANVGQRYRPQLSIAELFGPSVATVFKNIEVTNVMKGVIKSKFPKIFRRELEFRLSKLK